MGKITIEISIKDNKLYYQDSENHQGNTIESYAKAGDRIIWTVSKDSEIKDLTGMNIIGSPGYFKRGPSKRGLKKWTAKVSNKIKSGEIEYFIFYNNDDNSKMASTSSASTKSASAGPPKIKTL